MKNYCLINIENNTCENVVVWDGDTSNWSPPANCIALPQDSTPTKVWALSADKSNFELVVTTGTASIGFTWDGTYLTTNDPQPAPLVQPVVEGAQPL